MMSIALTVLFAGMLTLDEAPRQAAVQMELNRLRGSWVIQANSQEGKETPESLREVKRYTFEDNRYRVTFKGAERPLLEFRMKLDPTRTPKTIDLITMKSNTVVAAGIYELQGDTLKVCVPVRTGDRP